MDDAPCTALYSTKRPFTKVGISLLKLFCFNTSHFYMRVMGSCFIQPTWKNELYRSKKQTNKKQLLYINKTKKKKHTCILLLHAMHCFV